MTTTITRAQQKYFEGWALEVLTTALTQASVEQATIKHMLSLIDIKDYAGRLGAAVLSECSYRDIKALDKYSRDPAIIRATLAVESAIANTAASLNGVKNIAFASSMLTSGIHKGDAFMDALADADEAVQEAVIQQLTTKD